MLVIKITFKWLNTKFIHSVKIKHVQSEKQEVQLSCKYPVEEWFQDIPKKQRS